MKRSSRLKIPRETLTRLESTALGRAGQEVANGARDTITFCRLTLCNPCDTSPPC